jgi:hypothetical protein
MWEWAWQINILNKPHQQQIAKHNDEIESLGQLVASLTKEMVDKPSAHGIRETSLRIREKIKPVGKCLKFRCKEVMFTWGSFVSIELSNWTFWTNHGNGSDYLLTVNKSVYTGQTC